MLLRKEISFAMIAIFLATLAGAERVKRMYALCPPNFMRIGSECYFISSERVNWLDAHFECKDRNSRLAEPIKHEDRTLRKYLLHSDDSERNDVWIGGIYNWERKKWQWGYNGRDIAYQSFSQMAPGSSQDLRFHCAVLNPQLKYRWSARSCVDRHHYICQHRMPYVTESNRKKIYAKWNETYPNQMANENEVVLTEEELQRKERSRQLHRLNRLQNVNKNRKNPVVRDDRLTNSIDWQQPGQQRPQPIRNNNNNNNNNAKRSGQQPRNRHNQRNQHKRISSTFNGDVDNDIGNVNNNRVQYKAFQLETEYGLRPVGRRNRTRNPGRNRNNNDLFGSEHHHRKHKNKMKTTTQIPATTSTTTTSTTEASTQPPATTSTTTYLPPVIRYLDREPTSAEERYRIENAQIRMQEEVRRREKEEAIRIKQEYEVRAKHRYDLELRRQELEEREALKRKQQYSHEQRVEEETKERHEKARKQMEYEQEKNRRATEIREQGPSSVEQQPADVKMPAGDRQQNEVDDEEPRKQIDDARIQQVRRQEEEQIRRDRLRERLRKLTPEQLNEFYAKRAERNKKRDAMKKASTSIPDQ